MLLRPHPNAVPSALAPARIHAAGDVCAVTLIPAALPTEAAASIASAAANTWRVCCLSLLHARHSCPPQAKLILLADVEPHCKRGTAHTAPLAPLAYQLVLQHTLLPHLPHAALEA